MEAYTAFTKVWSIICVGAHAGMWMRFDPLTSRITVGVYLYHWIRYLLWLCAANAIWTTKGRKKLSFEKRSKEIFWFDVISSEVINFYLFVLLFQKFEGNANTYLEVVRDVSPPIIGKRIRFIPFSQTPRMVCMRVEMYGCPWTGRCNVEIFKQTLFRPHRIYVKHSCLLTKQISQLELLMKTDS